MFKLWDECRSHLALPYLAATAELDLNQLVTFLHPDAYPEEGKISLLTKDLLSYIISLTKSKNYFDYRLVCKKWNTVINPSLLPSRLLLIARHRYNNNCAYFIYHPSKGSRQLLGGRVSCHYHEPGDYLVVLTYVTMNCLNGNIPTELKDKIFASFSKYKPLGPETFEIIRKFGSARPPYGEMDIDDDISPVPCHLAMIQI